MSSNAPGAYGNPIELLSSPVFSPASCELVPDIVVIFIVQKSSGTHASTVSESGQQGSTSVPLKARSAGDGKLHHGTVRVSLQKTN